MASDIEIANMALGYCGDETITSLGSANKRARQCSLYFDSARRRALRLGGWNCNSKRASLGLDGTSPLWGYDNRYLLPSDEPIESGGAFMEQVARFSRRLLKRALAESGGNRAEAARRLGLSRQGLYKKIQRYKMTDLIGGN